MTEEDFEMYDRMGDNMKENVSRSSGVYNEALSDNSTKKSDSTKSTSSKNRAIERRLFMEDKANEIAEGEKGLKNVIAAHATGNSDNVHANKIAEGQKGLKRVIAAYAIRNSDNVHAD